MRLAVRICQGSIQTYRYTQQENMCNYANNEYLFSIKGSVQSPQELNFDNYNWEKRTIFFLPAIIKQVFEFVKNLYLDIPIQNGGQSLA